MGSSARSKRTHQPKYKILAQELASQITGGHWPPGAQLPPEETLAATRNVSRFTVRKALDLLEAQQMVQRTRGIGTTVVEEARRSRRYTTATTILLLFVAPRGRLPEPGSGFYRDLLSGVQQTARSLRLALRMQGLRSYLNVSLDEYCPPDSPDIGGVIVCGAFDDQYLRMFVTEAVPVVSADFYSHHPDIDSVVVDVESEAYMAVEHLAGKGHSRLGFVATGRRDKGRVGYDPDIHRMIDKLRHAAGRRQIDLRDEWIRLVPSGREPVQQAVREILALDPRPTSLICFDNIVAAQVLSAIRAAGLRCPEDVSLLGRGPTDIDEPPLTSLVSDPEMMGRLAVRLLQERMLRQRDRAIKIAVSSTLVLGQTTAPPSCP